MKIKALPLFFFGMIFIIFGIQGIGFRGTSHSDFGTFWYYGLVYGGYLAVIGGLLAVLLSTLMVMRYLIRQHIRYHGYEAWRDLERKSRTKIPDRYRVGGGR